MFTSPLGRRRVTVEFDLDNEPSITEQQHKQDCCIRSIVEKARKDGGLVNHLNPAFNRAQYGDFTNIPDFQTAQNMLIEAKNAFLSLPLRIRKQFDHDPAKMLEFIMDDRNYDEALKIGLIEAKTEAPAPADAAVAETTPKES